MNRCELNTDVNGQCSFRKNDVKIGKVPRILLIQIDRFANPNSKCNNQIEFFEQLTLLDTDKKEDVNYVLTGILGIFHFFHTIY